MSRRRRTRGAGLLLAATLAVTGCTSTDRTAEAFCEQLQTATGPDGAEVTFLPGDAGRVDAIVDELQLLLERAPDDIATTVASLIEFFESADDVLIECSTTGFPGG